MSGAPEAPETLAASPAAAALEGQQRVADPDATQPTGAGGPSAEEYLELVGELDQWIEDTEFQFPARVGMRLIVDLEPAEAAVVRTAAQALDADYVQFARRALLHAARATLGGPPDTRGAELSSDAAPTLTIAAAAERFGVKRDRLQRAAMEGRLPARKVGEGKSHPWLVRPADVERFLEAPHRTTDEHR